MNSNLKEKNQVTESKRKFPLRGIFMQLCGTCLGVGSGLVLGVELFSSENIVGNIFKIPALLCVSLIYASYVMYKSGSKETSQYMAK